MKALGILGEGLACISFLLFMFMLLIVGNAVMPYQPSMHSEAVYHRSGQ